MNKTLRKRNAAARTTRVRRPWRALGAAGAILGLSLAAVAATVVARGQRDFVAALVAAPPAARITQHAVGRTAQHETHEILLEDRDGAVRAALRVPRANIPVATIIIVGGLRTGRGAIDLLDPDLPCAVAAIDYACDVPRRVGAMDIVRLPGLQRDLLRTAVALRNLVAHIRDDPRLDPERVFIIGASLGAPFASAVAAAVSPSGLVLIHGFADHAALVEHRLRASVAAPVARRALAHVAGLLTAGLDVRRTLPLLHDIPVLVLEAAEDEMIPTACRTALWEATREPRQRAQVPGGHLRGGQRTEVLREAMTLTRRWLALRGVPELAL